MLRDSADPLEEAAVGLRLADLQTVAELLQKAIDAQPERECELLQAAAVCAPEGFWLPFAGQIAGLGDADLRAVRDRLVNSSLLRVLDRDRRRFQLHSLLREQVRVSAPLADLEERHAVELEGIFKEWETRWRDCRECLDEVIAAMERLWRVGAAGGVGGLSDWGFKVGWRVGELEASLRILDMEESLWLGRGGQEARRIALRSYGNRAIVLQVWGRSEEAMTLLKQQEALCLELATRMAYRSATATRP
jgi:hypothetical protein